MAWNIYDGNNRRIGRIKEDSGGGLIIMLCFWGILFAIIALAYSSPYLLGTAGGIGGFKVSRRLKGNVYLAILISLIGGFLGVAAGDQIYRSLEIGWHAKKASTSVKTKPKEVVPEQRNLHKQNNEVAPARLESFDQVHSKDQQQTQAQAEQGSPDQMSRLQQEKNIMADQEATRRLQDIEMRLREQHQIQESKARDAERPSTVRDIGNALKEILVYDKSDGRYQLTSPTVIKSEFQRQCTQEVMGLPVKVVKDALIVCLNKRQP